jgi:tetratricopeptide (TPR) repeat protein
MRAASGLGIAVALLFLALLGFAAPVGPEAALAEGNRRFEKEDVEAALEAYTRGYSGGGSAVDGVLAYNAGTCALRLGRLPEALLWYRRAEAAAPGDPWLRDNLALTRRALGDPPEEDPAWGGWLAGRRGLAVAGVALAWGTLALLLTARRPSGWLLASLALLACACFASGMLLDRFGPRAAVLLAACPAKGDGLPAGREVWVRPAGDGWHVIGETRKLRCPVEAVGLVEP